MTRPVLGGRAAALALLALACAATWVGDAAAEICAKTDQPTLLWSSCDGAYAASLRLLPEDAGVTPEGALDVTGAYTATDRREGGRPKPVGLMVRAGTVISREYVRFDGVLAIDGEGGAAVGYRRRFPFGDDVYDLEDRERRAALLEAVAASGGSLMQSHLLIIDGAVDAAPIDGAPRFRRRILMQDETGALGLFDSSPRALTLNEAAEEVAEVFAPAMALNLDMGSYDFCRRGGDLCGALSYGQTGKLSNLLRFLTR